MVKMQTGTVEMVPVEWIIQNVEHSADGYEHGGGLNVEDMVYAKGTDYGFGDLLYTIATRGFRVPIVLNESSFFGGLQLGNGHHRLTAALLLCLDEIPVYWSRDDYMSLGVSDTEQRMSETPWQGLEDDLWNEL